MRQDQGHSFYERHSKGGKVKAIVLAVILATASVPASAVAAPSAETAKRCMHYSYVVYPYKRPGSVRGGGDRQAYFRGCMVKDGNVPEPAPANPDR
jgi:hypothetical protein